MMSKKFKSKKHVRVPAANWEPSISHFDPKVSIAEPGRSLPLGFMGESLEAALEDPDFGPVFIADGYAAAFCLTLTLFAGTCTFDLQGEAVAGEGWELHSEPALARTGDVQVTRRDGRIVIEAISIVGPLHAPLLQEKVAVRHAIRLLRELILG